MRLWQLTLTVALLLVSPTLRLLAGGPIGGLLCPRCHQPCHATVEKTTETKHCWDVQIKPICIPRVTFPWQRRCGKDGCPLPAKCGRVKYVNVLVKHEYQCPTCKYTWRPDSSKDHAKVPTATVPSATGVPPTRVHADNLNYGDAFRLPLPVRLD